MSGTTLVVGDSLGDGGSKYPDLLSTPVDDQTLSGNELIVDIEPAYSTTLANRLNGTEVTQCVIQGGVNDIKISDETAANMMAAVVSMVALAHGTTNISRVFVVGVSPWKNFSTWTAAWQVKTDAYNALLLANQATYNYTYVDIYAPLEDPANADELLPAYDNGDGLHPSIGAGSGSEAIAAEINTALGDFIVPLINAETYKWRGAVEPSETSSIGNQYATWRGAIEPTAINTVSAGGSTTRIRRANDAAWWYEKMRLKREDDEALKLIDKYLDS